MTRAEQNHQAQDRWIRRYGEMNTPGEVGPRIARAAEVTESGWPFRIAELNARKAGFDKVAAACGAMAYYAEHGAVEKFERGFVTPRTLTVRELQAEQHVYDAMDMINHILTGSTLDALGDGLRDKQLDDIFALAGISQEERQQATPIRSTDTQEIFTYESNLGVTLIEHRNRNKDIGNDLLARKTQAPQKAAA